MSETPRTEAGNELWRYVYGGGSSRVKELIVKTEDEAAALAHDRPSDLEARYEAEYVRDMYGSGLSDPEAVGLDSDVLAKALLVVPTEIAYLPRWADRIAAEYARLTEAKPESPA